MGSRIASAFLFYLTGDAVRESYAQFDFLFVISCIQTGLRSDKSAWKCLVYFLGLRHRASETADVTIINAFVSFEAIQGRGKIIELSTLP